MYARGTSEEVLGEVGWVARGLSVATKIYPTAVRARACYVGVMDLS